jgi:hypothetical protein
MADRERELEQRIKNLAVHLEAFAYRLSRAEFIVSKVRHTLETSNSLDLEAFKKIDAESWKINPQHPVVLEAKRKISLVMKGFALGKSPLSDY